MVARWATAANFIQFTKTHQTRPSADLAVQVHRIPKVKEGVSGHDIAFFHLEGKKEVLHYISAYQLRYHMLNTLGHEVFTSKLLWRAQDKGYPDSIELVHSEEDSGEDSEE